MTKSKMLKMAASAAVLILTAAALAACGSNKSSDGSSKSSGGSINSDAAMKNYKAGEQFKATKKINVTALFQDNPAYPYKKTWALWNEITKKTNVKLDLTIVPFADYDQKRSLLISSGNAPTIINKTYPGQETAFVASKTILPVSDYVKYMPNFQNFVKKYKMEPDLQTVRQSDGKYYVLPGMHEEVWQDYSVVVRTDLFKKYNIDIPTTWTELGTAMKKLKAADSDLDTVLSDRFTGSNLLKLVAASNGAQAGWGLGNGASYNWDKKAYQYAPTMTGYKDMVKMLNGWVSDGILDKESFSQTDDQAQQKFVTGKSAMISGNAQNVIDYQTSMDSNLGKGKYSIAKINLPGGTAGHLLAENTRLENGIMINANIKKNKNFKAILQFIDWLYYSPEGQQFTKWGVKGETYTDVSSDGKYTLKDGINFLGLNPNGGSKDLRKDFGYSGGNFSYGGSTKLLQSTMNDSEIKFQNEDTKVNKQAKVAPAAPLAQEDQQPASLLATPLSDYTNQNTLKFITGERPLSQYNDFLSELKKKGSDKYITMINKAAKQYADKYGK